MKTSSNGPPTLAAEFSVESNGSPQSESTRRTPRVKRDASAKNESDIPAVRTWAAGKWRDSGFDVITSYRGTFIPLVLASPVFYLCLYTFAAMCIVNATFYEDDDHLDRSGLKGATHVVSLMTSMVMLYIAFYNAVVYARFHDQWTYAQVGYGRINDLNLLAPAYMNTPENKEARDRVIRFANAYHHLVYLEQGKVERAEILKLLVDRDLLTKEEQDVLLPMNCSVGMRLLIWTTQTIAESGIDPMYQHQMNEIVVVLRRNMAFLWSYDDMPIPFIYFHLVEWLVSVGALMQSVANAFLFSFFEDGTLRIGAIFFQVIFQIVSTGALIGMKKVSDSLGDPFARPTSRLNSIPACRYMDMHAVADSKLAKYNDDGPPKVEVSPDFKEAHDLMPQRGGIHNAFGGVDLEARNDGYKKWIDICTAAPDEILKSDGFANGSFTKLHAAVELAVEGLHEDSAITRLKISESPSHEDLTLAPCRKKSSELGVDSLREDSMLNTVKKSFELKLEGGKELL